MKSFLCSKLGPSREGFSTHCTNQCHPVGLLQAALEAHAGVGGGGARHARLHQLLEAVLHLPHVTHLNGNHLPLLERVLLSSLNAADNRDLK